MKNMLDIVCFPSLSFSLLHPSSFHMLFFDSSPEIVPPCIQQNEAMLKIYINRAYCGVHP